MGDPQTQSQQNAAALPPAMRMLTEDEVVQVRKRQTGYGAKGLRPWGATLDFADALQREFCRVNNLQLAT